MAEAVGHALATGLAALIGLFNTDSVEVTALATYHGFYAVIISSLSMLGILGLVKNTLKMSLGLELCKTAGFSLDSLRGIFGYEPGEAAITGDLVNCDAISLTITEEKDIIVHKTKLLLDNVRTPIVSVGSDWPFMSHTTAVNLGNAKLEASQRSWIAISFATMCSGATTWILLVIKSPWTWVRVFATVGLHTCLVSMVLIPVWYDWQTARPWWHLTSQGWELLNGSIKEKSQIHLLQARINGGDVIHFQGATWFLTSPTFKVSAFIVMMITVVAYLCQYSIV